MLNFTFPSSHRHYEMLFIIRGRWMDVLAISVRDHAIRVRGPEQSHAIRDPADNPSVDTGKRLVCEAWANPKPIRSRRANSRDGIFRGWVVGILGEFSLPLRG